MKTDEARGQSRRGKSEGGPVTGTGSDLRGDRWRVLMVRHVNPMQRRDGSFARALIDCGRPLVAEYCLDSDGNRKWLDGTAYLVMPGPWIVTVAIRRQPWLHIIPSFTGLVAVDRLATAEELDVLTVWFDPAARLTQLRFYRQGKLTVDFASPGQGADPLHVVRFDSRLHPERFLNRVKTVATAVAAIAKSLGANPRRLGVRLVGRGLQLYDEESRPLTKSQISEVHVRSLVPLMAAENPASVRLAEAIIRGNPAEVRRALSAGASLEFLPDSNLSPLVKALYSKAAGDWRGVIRALVRAGASLEGHWWEQPAMPAAVSPFHDEQSVLNTIKLLRTLGADIDARVRGPQREAGMTALHQAVINGQLTVVRWLVDQGARLDLHDGAGRSPLALAEELAGLPPFRVPKPFEQIAAFLRASRRAPGQLQEIGG